MADVAASVLARLKNKAAKSGRSYQLCLQLFCQEEFLRRQAVSRKVKICGKPGSQRRTVPLFPHGFR